MAGEIVNRVEKSGIVSLNLEELLPSFPIVSIDLKDQLFQEMILREKDFREWIKTNDWSQYEGKHVALFCSADAIIPTWAYMLVGTKLDGIAASYFTGEAKDLKARLIESFINEMNAEDYRDARVVIKGCSDEALPVSAYTAVAAKLQPVVKSLLFGEPCSTVPLWKKPRSKA